MKRRKRNVSHKRWYEIRKCEFCGGIANQKHHYWKSAVWKGFKEYQSTIVKFLCKDCHQKLEMEITKQENIILRQHPKLYTDTFEKVKRKIQNEGMQRHNTANPCSYGAEPTRNDFNHIAIEETN